MYDESKKSINKYSNLNRLIDFSPPKYLLVGMCIWNNQDSVFYLMNVPIFFTVHSKSSRAIFALFLTFAR